VSRRLVVILFLDLVGWTRLAERVDPEPLQLMLEQYYEICSAAVEEHGGIVEKFIGDAIMAVFGAARSEENDALRALRAAAQIRADISDLNHLGDQTPALEIHCGIAAGEALVTHSSRAGLRIVGDVVNLAARLQSMAVAGEILVNQVAAHLARPHYMMVPTAPLAVKGKAEPVQAFLVTGPAALDSADGTLPMVNRKAERDRLREAYHRVTRDQRSAAITVIGPSGIGKTRLVREMVDEFCAAESEPIAVFGDCPPYGPNGNYIALVQVLGALTEQATPSADLVQADRRIAAVLTSMRHAAQSRGEDTGPGPGVEEMSWAVRELLAAAAGVRPLIMVWDSLEWAGDLLLRLIGELMVSLSHLPILMICVARPELAELDIPWIRSFLDRDVIDVCALTPADSAQMAAWLIAASQDAEVQAHEFNQVDRVTIYSAGNPLFIRLMLESAMSGRPIGEVPPTITAMVGAMIDRLPAQTQELLSAVSVISTTFTLEQLGFLGEPVPETGIDDLVARQLICAAAQAGEYGFVQQSVHEVAYGRLDKERRCAWHRRLAEHGVSPGFHFEAAVRLLRDLRPHDAELGQLARRAAGALLAEGTAALRQRDVQAAIGLLDRALDLVPSGPDRHLEVAAIRLSDALMLSGDMQRAVEVVTEVAQQSLDERVQRPCLVQQHLLAVRLRRVSGAAVAKLLASLENDKADHLAWCRFEQLRMLLHLESGCFGAAEQAVCAALEHARSMGDAYEEDRLLAALCEVRQWSPTSVTEKLAGCAELAERFAADRFLLVPVLAAQARCLALIGDRAGARAALAEAGTVVEQLRLTMGQILVDQAAGFACSLEGEHAESERHFRRAADALEQAGHVPIALTLKVQAARERARQDPASGAAREIAVLAGRREEMDVRGRILCMSATVRLAAAGGITDPVLGDVLSLLEGTDDPCLRGEVYVDLAQAHRHLGHHADAEVMARAAIDSYATVGATQPIQSVQAWM
jgi:class 3 adenylate cyclase/tetratricopeptide (TPR) repeat protein